MTVEKPIEAMWEKFWGPMGQLDPKLAALEPLLRRVFFGGAFAMFELLGDAAEKETDDLPTVDAIVAEIRRFVDACAKEGSVKAN